MVAWFALDGPVREVIHKFKYGDRPNLAGPLVELGLRQGDLPLGVVVPVPWAANRRRHRGYNQAEALLRKIAAGTGRQQLEGLRRVRETDAQVGLGGEERGGEERAGPSRGRSLGGGGSQKRSCWWTMWSPPGPRWSNAPGLPGPRA
jgi:predicted amidophosphoribosyltransferase